VSELARRTYLEAGVPEEKVVAVPLGVDIELFAPHEQTAQGTDQVGKEAGGVVAGEGPAQPGDEAGQEGHGDDGGPCRPLQDFVFLFAGAAIYRKGFDLLLEAFASAAEGSGGVRLRVVGPLGESARLLALYPDLLIEPIGPVDQGRLAAELRGADCLVLPSRQDSYGMVVVEALASGVPVVVSEMVGAAAVVAAGVNGWVVPARDAGALGERMGWCLRHPDEVRAMRAACRGSAEAATWAAYHRRLAEVMERVLAGTAGPPDRGATEAGAGRRPTVAPGPRAGRLGNDAAAATQGGPSRPAAPAEAPR
jgi:glycosyltransferase involved in cell wall biosynthesis